MKLQFSIVLVALFLLAPASAKEVRVLSPIDAAKNAKEHNNQGAIFLREGDYYAAIKEFKIAIGINPNTQATSTYYNNLGLAYMKIYEINKVQAVAAWAESCFNQAISMDCMNLTYYSNIVDSWAAQGKLNSKINYLLANKNANPYNEVMAGLIYIKQKNIPAGITTLNNFVMQNPDLIISKDIKRLIKNHGVI